MDNLSQLNMILKIGCISTQACPHLSNVTQSLPSYTRSETKTTI